MIRISSITNIKIFLLLVITNLKNINASCDNQCSGHGTCLVDDVCQCYDNWGIGLSHDSGDCSERICPYEIAFIDSPNVNGEFHRYAECAGRGICNRASGECECFSGYEGKGCQRTTCPNDCSGHGTCEFIEDLYYGATWNDYSKIGFHADPKTFDYHLWDVYKSRACVCDATYGDYDCSKRMCPYGTDVLDLRDNLLVSGKYQTQQLLFAARSVNNQGKTFALTFKSKLNESFTTQPIVFDPDDITDFVHDIQLALLKLPNRVIDGVAVQAKLLDSVYDVSVNITFTGDAVQGPQFLLTVEDYECSSGCTPRLSGLTSETRINYHKSNVTEYQASDYHSYECGRRGKCDYNTGLCQCFLGYTGDNCNTLTTLV